MPKPNARPPRAPRSGLAALLVLVAFAALACPRADRSSPELETYLDARRKAAMSEMAEANLRTMAGILAGTEIVSYLRDEARHGYGTRYQSRYCPKPGADPQEVAAARQREHALEEEPFRRLRALADADRSGFVTSEEAEELRLLLEFGAKANYVAEREGSTPEALAAWLGLSGPELADEADRYRALVSRAGQAEATLEPLAF